MVIGPVHFVLGTILEFYEERTQGKFILFYFFLFQSSSILVQITFIFSFLVYFSNCSSDNGYPNPNSQHWNTLIIIPAPLSFGRIGRVLLSPTHHLFVNWYCLNMRLLWPSAINGLVPTGILTLTYLPNTTLLSIS